MGHLAIDGIAEPIINDVAGKSSFPSLQERLRKIRAANLTMEPFPRTVPDLELRGQAFHVLDNFLVDKRHTQFKAMCHRKFVRVHQEFVWKR